MHHFLFVFAPLSLPLFVHFADFRTLLPLLFLCCSGNSDIETIEALAGALREYEGGVVLVSHDARLIREAGCELWVVDKQTVSRFDGDVDDYRDQLLDEIEEAAEKAQAELQAKLERRAKERAEKLKAARARSQAAAARKTAASS